MHIICLTPLEPGVYNDHASDSITTPPDGWAYIPDDFPLPSTFPRLDGIKTELLPYVQEVETQDEDGNAAIKTVEYTMLTVTAMTEGRLPEPMPEPEPEPTADELINALLGVSE